MPADGPDADERSRPAHGSESSDADERPWNDPSGVRASQDDAAWSDLGDRPIGELGGEDPLADVDAAATIGRRSRILEFSYVPVATVAMFVVYVSLNDVVGYLPAALLAIGLGLVLVFGRTVYASAEIVLETDRDPPTVRAQFADHRLPIYALSRAGADRIDRQDNGAELTYEGLITGAERCFRYRSYQDDSGGIGFEAGVGETAVATGRVRVDPAEDGGSRVHVQVDRANRIAVRELFGLPFREWYDRRLREEMGYETVEEETEIGLLSRP